MLARIQPRLIYFAIFLACVGLMAFGLYLQYVERLEPCPLCILQRYSFVAAGIVALIAGLHNPGRAGRVIYGLLLILSSGAGAVVAIRQSWLQHNPPNIQECGPDLAYMIDSFPLSQWLPKVFKGEGDCAKVVWKFLGLSIPEWALVWFAIFIVAAVIGMTMRPSRR